MREPKQGPTSDAPPRSSIHTLHMKVATIALKRAKLIGEESDYASTPESNDLNGLYMSPDHESSEESEDMDSE